eukprot:CAMPEP_0204608816 /NCGR_PEP_ID=MMETSP0661-20131031/60545_1 /ASSEMBLY_ACC=CAM_ASM_000606 /TAXON_ID=109239 /ORGANISM="Alexandrium margalefi, Strain AMGDE01CS-322" /LENGTH=47 /DNA_ID= /DNA_START= /DNA_END= /DNA_ORIENTATION=
MRHPLELGGSKVTAKPAQPHAAARARAQGTSCKKGCAASVEEWHALQ